MMRRILVGAAVLFTLLMVATRPAEAQGLASLAAAASGSSMSMEKTPSCWSCQSFQSVPDMCVASSGSGTYAKCSANFSGVGCTVSSPCGSSAMLPVDLDGASQYVSRGSRLGTLASHKEGDPEVRRNCNGVVVARFQTPDAIAQVRSSTGTLSL